MAACGSLGSTLALWREKTFQALAMTVLALVFWLAVGEIVAAGLLGDSLAGISCGRLGGGGQPLAGRPGGDASLVAVRAGLGLPDAGPPVSLTSPWRLTLLLNGLAVAMVRRWNPSRRLQPAERGARVWAPLRADRPDSRCRRAPRRAAARTRRVWDNPILWREIRTWAYGRKMLVIRLAYVLLFGLAAASLHADRRRRQRRWPPPARARWCRCCC